MLQVSRMSMLKCFCRSKNNLKTPRHFEDINNMLTVFQQGGKFPHGIHRWVFLNYLSK